MKMAIEALWCEGDTRMARVAAALGRASMQVHTRRKDLAVGDIHCADLTVFEPILRGENAWSSDARVFCLRDEERHVVLEGLVDGVDDDGVFYFRLDEGCLVILEAVPGDVRAEEWLRLRIERASIHVYL